VSDPGRALHDLGALEAASLMADGRLTSVVLVEHLAARIADLEPRLHALIAVHPEALAQARVADDRRRAFDLLHETGGLPLILPLTGS